MYRKREKKEYALLSLKRKSRKKKRYSNTFIKLSLKQTHQKIKKKFTYPVKFTLAYCIPKPKQTRFDLGFMSLTKLFNWKNQRKQTYSIWLPFESNKIVTPIEDLGFGSDSTMLTR